MVVVPYHFRRAAMKIPSHVAYWVTLYCFFDGEQVHHFFHQSEHLENMCLAHELGYSVEPFYKDILVDKTHFPDIFQEICNYVHLSDTD